MNVCPSHFAIAVLVALILWAQRASSQLPGDIDLTFNTMDVGFGKGYGANHNVNATALLPDGKVLLGGGFTGYEGYPAHYIARTLPDGTNDTTFATGEGASSTVDAIAVQPDGKIIIGGIFSSYQNIDRQYIARLLEDGNIDTTFNPGTGAIAYSGYGTVSAILVQPDGKIIIGGVFNEYNGVPRNGIARLNTDGSLDLSFSVGDGTNGSISSITLQPDGKVIISGNFTIYNGVARSGIARLNSTGSLDVSFMPGTGANNTILSNAMQPDGKIIIGGYFTSFDGTLCNRIARLNTDGTIDLSFVSGTGADNFISSTLIQADGKIIIGGSFHNYNNISRKAVARLLPDGSLDPSFNSGAGITGIIANNIRNMDLQPDGKIIISGYFETYNGVSRNNFARINSDGNLDTAFCKITGANYSIISTAIQPDGKILISGNFTNYNNTTIKYIARIHSEGTLDSSFNLGAGPTSPTEIRMALQPDGKVIAVGYFTEFNGMPFNSICRLNSDGSLDTSFTPGSGANGFIKSVALQTDGKILIGGFFTSFDGVSRNRLARLNIDGSLDTSFNSGVGGNTGVLAIKVQLDGKILIGGTFNIYDNISRPSLARLNTNGSLDLTFDAALITNGLWYQSSVVLAIDLQSDGKIVMGGYFTTVNSINRNHIARLHASGALDTTFNPGTGFSGGSGSTITNTLQVLPNNKLLVGGRFTNFNGIARRNLVKLNADGSLDTSFNYLSGPNYDVNSIALQPDGNFILTGQFLSYNGVGRNRIAKVLGGEAVSIPLIETGIISASTMCTGATILVPFSASGPLFFGNTFNAQLSDPSGSFANPLVIGSLTSTIGDTIQATIPYGVLAGTGYRIRVVASNLASTGFDNGMDLTINPTPVLSVLPLANTVCEGDSVSLAASGASIYTWLPGNFTGANITVYPDSTVTYSVTGYLNGCSASSSTAITVLPKPIAGFSYQISSCCEVILTNQTIGGATYEYDFGDGSLTSIQENPSYTYSIPGLYTITQTVTNAAGCIDTAALTIPIILSVDDYYHSGIKLYPNPAKDILRIDFPENNTDQIVTIEILNLLGSFLKKMEVSGNSTMLMVNDLPNGAYLIKIRSTGSTALKQLVVHH